MSSIQMTCAMCGSQFDPEAHGACQSCPLHKGCTLVCCPVCGFQTVNTGKSHLAQFAKSLFNKNREQDIISKK